MDNWISRATKKKGALHKALHIPEDNKIPAKMLKPKPSDSPLMKQRKNLAKTLRKFND